MIPSASVVVETVNALHYGVYLLFRAIESIYDQCSSDSEIVIVDTGLPREARLALLNRFRRVRIIDAPKVGYFQAKNIGYHQARGSVVVFLDSDCTASDSWLAAIKEPFSKGADAVAGRTFYQGRFLARVMNITDWGFFPFVSESFTKFFAANNIALRKTAHQHLFDESFWRTGGDITMANAMFRRGIRVHFEPSAKVYHHFPYRLSDFLEMRLQEGFHVIETRKADRSLRGGNLLAARALAPILYYFGRLALDADAIRRHKQTMAIGPFQAPMMFVFAAAFRFIDMMGMMLTLAARAAIKRKFDW